jgi:hypothetical protein
MTVATFLVGFVLALALGAALAAVWMRARHAAEEARAAADAARPLAGTLERIEAQMREFEAQRQHMLGGLEAHLAALSKDTVALAQALRGSNARGRWGELTLKRVAELAGMAPYCDFDEQVSSGGRRPDMLVRLPGGRTLPVDAKTPLSAYLEAEAASDAQARAAALERHAQQVWRHVAELSAREYWAQFDTAPEMVVLFLPGEHFLSAALEQGFDRDPGDAGERAERRGLRMAAGAAGAQRRGAAAHRRRVPRTRARVRRSFCRIGPASFARRRGLQQIRRKLGCADAAGAEADARAGRGRLSGAARTGPHRRRSAKAR